MRWSAPFLVIVAVALPGMGVFVPRVPAEEPKAEKKQPALTDVLGDPLPEGAVARLGTTRLRHPERAWSVLFSHDGANVFSAGARDGVRVWDVVTGRELAPFTAPDGWADCLALSQDGKTLVTGGGFLIRIWDVAKRRQSGAPMEQRDLGQAVAISPDGRVIAGADARGFGVRLWDSGRRERIRTLTFQGLEQEVRAVDFAPDGKTLVAGGRDFVALFEVSSGKTLWQAKGLGTAVSVKFLRDGKTVIVGPLADDLVTLLDVATGKPMPTPKKRGGVLAVSPDDKLVASSGFETPSERGAARQDVGVISLWDRATGKETQRLSGHVQHVSALAFSPDGKTLASAGGEGTVIMWDVQSGKRLHPPLGHDAQASGVAYSPNGKMLATRGQDLTIRVWDLAKVREVRRLQIPEGPTSASVGRGDEMNQSLAWSADGKFLATHTFGRLVYVWDAETGRLVSELKGTGGRVRCLAFAPSGATLACGDDMGRVSLSDAATGREQHRLDWQSPKTPEREREAVESLSFSRDGKRLAANFASGIRVWDTARGKKLTSEFASQGLNIAFCGIEETLAAASPGYRSQKPCIKFLPLSTGKVRSTRPIPGTWDIGWMCLSASPDGSLVASAGWEDWAIHVWEAATSREVARFEGHRAPVLALAFSPDGTALASASADSTTLVWDLFKIDDGEEKAGTEAFGEHELATAWLQLARWDAQDAYQALARLAANPEKTLPFLRNHLQPSREVKVAKVLRQLDDESFGARQAASERLREMGQEVRPALERALADSPSAEARRRIQEVLDRFQADEVDLTLLRQHRAVRLLERIGTKEARQLLEELAKGWEIADQTRAARAALHRLAQHAP